MLATIGYSPAPRKILTAWMQLEQGVDRVPSPTELRTFLGNVLPAHAIPAAFVAVGELPMTTNGKLDTAALPPPERVHRSSPAIQLLPETPLEALVVSTWEQVLAIEPISVDDDFFAIGGDSLAALEMIVLLGERVGGALLEELPFVHTTPRRLAAEITRARGLQEPTSIGRPPAPVSWDEAPPLSVGEQSILFDHLRNAGGGRYNVGHRYNVGGEVDVDLFTAALRDVAARHVPLSWSYGSPRRHLTSEEAVSVSASPEPVDENDVAALVDRFVRVPFDLDDGPLLRCLIQPVLDGTTAVAVVLHHVSGDAEGLMALWDQVDAAYDGRAPVELETDYPGYSAWLRQRLTEADRSQWTVHADGPPSATLGILRPDRATEDGFVRRTASFTPDHLRAGAGATGFAAALSALACVLRRSSDCDRIEVGVIASIRTHAAAAPLIGYLLNTLPVVIDCPDDLPFGELTGRTGAVVGTALAHRSYPLADIVADRRAAGAPLPTMSVLMAFHELGTGGLGGLAVDHEVLFNGTAVSDATFFVEVRSDRVDLAIEYRGSVMTGADAERLLTDVDELLRQGLAQPSLTSGSIPVPSDGTGALSGGPLAHPDTLLAQILHNIAFRAAEPAVRCGSESMSWAELGENSARIARQLRAAAVGSGDRVIVCMPRSVDLIGALIGVLRAGGAYVPIDPEYPADRIHLMSEISGATVALVADPDLSVADLNLCVGTRPDGGLRGRAAVEPMAEAFSIDLPVSADDDAYVIFTSGSTGTPRGVAVDHGRLAASTAARDAVYERAPDRFLLVSSIGFDSSVAGLFWTLAAGGSLVVPTDSEAHDPDALLDLISSAVGDTHPDGSHVVPSPPRTGFHPIGVARRRDRGG